MRGRCSFTPVAAEVPESGARVSRFARYFRSARARCAQCECFVMLRYSRNSYGARQQCAELRRCVIHCASAVVIRYAMLLFFASICQVPPASLSHMLLPRPVLEHVGLLMRRGDRGACLRPSVLLLLLCCCSQRVCAQRLCALPAKYSITCFLRMAEARSRRVGGAHSRYVRRVFMLQRCLCWREAQRAQRGASLFPAVPLSCRSRVFARFFSFSSRCA